MKTLFCAALLVALTGCTNSLYFGTYTRVGIDASADGAGIGGKNATLNIAPTKKDGSTFDVLGTSDVDLSYSDVIISERLAVGEAARCAAVKSPSLDRATIMAGTEKPPTAGPVIFGTYSSFSLVDLSLNNSVSPGITFGYKRGTGLRMPVENDEVGSAYASISVNTSDKGATHTQSAIGGIRNKHVFATGTAALIKASEDAPALNGGNNAFKGCITPATPPAQ